MLNTHTLRLTGLLALIAGAAFAAPPEFPPFGAEKSIRGELVEADFIHRTGSYRTKTGELRRFTMPPYAIMTYQGAESDLREVPLGAELEFLLIPDEDGQLTQLVGTKHGDKPNKGQRQKFVEFTQDRGLAGWIDRTAGKTLTLIFFSNAPTTFTENWGDAFDKGAAVTVCVANDELRTWQPTSCGEKGTIIETETIPISGHGCSGQRVVIQVNNMLEGFRQGRIVRVFGAGWKVRNQLFQECLINYGYQQQPAPDFRECLAKHYPEQFPYRTDHGNRHLPWFQIKEGIVPPSFAEHCVYGALTQVDGVTNSGEFRIEGSDQVVKFTMLSAGERRKGAVSQQVRFQSTSREGASARLANLELGLRYRFHLYQDPSGQFTRCGFITDDASQAVLNSLNYQVRNLDLKTGRLEVAWQANPVKNYNGDMETPPPYGHSVLRVSRETKVSRDKSPAELADLKPEDLLRFNRTAEFAGKPAGCTDLWIVNVPKRGDR